VGSFVRAEREGRGNNVRWEVGGEESVRSSFWGEGRVWRRKGVGER
jgi:hypothetical protein